MPEAGGVSKRAIEALRMLDSGMSYGSIARDMGVSRTRAKQLCERGKELRMLKTVGMDCLGGRAINALITLFQRLPMKDEVVSVSDEMILSIRGIGKKTLTSIRVWASR